MTAGARATLRRAAPWIGVLALVAVLGTTLIMEAHREVTDPGDSDAIALVAGGHLVVSNPTNMYSPVAQERTEASLLNIPVRDHFIAPFTNIAAGALLLSPLAHTNLWVAAEMSVFASTLLFALALLLAFRLLAPVPTRSLQLAIAVATVLNIPAVEAIVQWDSLMTVALLGSVLLARRRQYGWAGLLLATLILKPQVLWLVVPALIAARSWRYLAGLLAGSAAWIAVSVVITRPPGFAAFLNLVATTYPGQTDRSIGLPSLVSAVTGSGHAGFIAAGCLGAIAVAVIISLRGVLRGQPVAAVAVGLVLSLLCSPHVTTEDFMLIALPIALIARRWPLLALGEAVAISVVEIVQLQLPTGVQHLQPFVLAAIAITTLLAVKHVASSTTTNSPERTARVSRGVELERHLPAALGGMRSPGAQ
jgi:Glycosyltransferase family 87